MRRLQYFSNERLYSWTCSYMGCSAYHILYDTTSYHYPSSNAFSVGTSLLTVRSASTKAGHLTLTEPKVWNTLSRSSWASMYRTNVILVSSTTLALRRRNSSAWANHTSGPLPLLPFNIAAQYAVLYWAKAQACKYSVKVLFSLPRALCTGLLDSSGKLSLDGYTNPDIYSLVTNFMAISWVPYWYIPLS